MMDVSNYENSAGKIQFRPGACTEGIKKSSVSKALVLLYIFAVVPLLNDVMYHVIMGPMCF